MAEALDLSGDTLTDGDGNTTGLKIGSPVTIGGVTLTAAVGTVNTLSFSGALLSGHDALYAYAQDLNGTGALTPETAQDVGMPRWPMAATGTSRVKWVWAIPAAWNTVALRWAWAKEAAGSGNVKWQLAYRMVFPFTGEDVDASAVTTVSFAAAAVSGTTFGLQYQIQAELENLSVGEGAFGSKPFMLCSLSRLADDGTDTYTGVVSTLLATLTRVT